MVHYELRWRIFAYIPGLFLSFSNSKVPICTAYEELGVFKIIVAETKDTIYNSDE